MYLFYFIFTIIIIIFVGGGRGEESLYAVCATGRYSAVRASIWEFAQPPVIKSSKTFVSNPKNLSVSRFF